MADFLDKIKDGLNKGVATVSAGSKTMIEKTKINNTIKNLEREKQQLSEILGNKIYNFFLSNPESDVPRVEVEGICNEISSRTEQIKFHSEKLKELDAEMNHIMGKSNGENLQKPCQCGQLNEIGAKFCANCGTKLI